MTDHVETTLPVLIFTATIPGDVWAPGRLVLDNDAAASQYSLAWGLESRYYDPATSLFYNATGTTDAGSYGGSTRRVTLGSGETSVISWSGLQNVGMFRVFARMRDNSDLGLGTYVQLAWRAAGSTVARNQATFLDQTSPEAGSPQYRIVDLGTVHLPKPIRGNPDFYGEVFAWNTSGVTVDLDYYFFVPCLESSGRANGLLVPGDELGQTPVVTANKSIEIRYDAALELTDSANNLWGPVVGYSGDYMLVPNSGSEGRTARVIAKFSRGRIRSSSVPLYDATADSAVDDISGRLFATPRFLT